MPLFSVILATRDRPALFADALRSVLAQDNHDFEVVVVNDGSSEEHRAAYEEVLEAARSQQRPVQSHWLIRRPRGHGQSYALNFGVSQASGTYVCFLDDDDIWLDHTHLSRAARVLEREAADLYMANQVAFRGETRLPGPVWIEELADAMARRGVKPVSEGALAVGVSDLMGLHGFCHLNALTVRKSLYEAIGGMDETIRWECDRDVFLRLVDRAEYILHHPAVVARHNVPDPAKAASMTTSLATLERWLFQIRVLDKAAIFARHTGIRSHARQHKAFALKRVTEDLAQAGNWTTAAYYGWQALAAGPTLKWLCFASYCFVRHLSRGSDRP
jgi:glycosyltransferase involved in cell wall biosynthesis